MLYFCDENFFLHICYCDIRIPVGPCQISVMELFFENNQLLLDLHDFYKKVASVMFDRS